MENFTQVFLFVFATFLPIMNPFGGAMFFLSLTPGASTSMRYQIAKRVAIYSFLVLMVSIFAGRLILSFFGISLPVLQVGGGIVLFSAGWKALNAPPVTHGKNKAEPSSQEESTLLAMAFYPLTLPLTTGPGTIAAAAALGSGMKGDVWSILGCITACIAIAVLTAVCFGFSDKIPKAVGVTGADALARVFAFILICIGVVLFWAGFSALWQTLPR